MAGFSIKDFRYGGSSTRAAIETKARCGSSAGNDGVRSLRKLRRRSASRERRASFRVRARRPRAARLREPDAIEDARRRRGRGVPEQPVAGGACRCARAGDVRIRSAGHTGRFAARLPFGGPGGSNRRCAVGSAETDRSGQRGLRRFFRQRRRTAAGTFPLGARADAARASARGLLLARSGAVRTRGTAREPRRGQESGEYLSCDDRHGISRSGE